MRKLLLTTVMVIPLVAGPALAQGTAPAPDAPAAGTMTDPANTATPAPADPAAEAAAQAEAEAAAAAAAEAQAAAAVVESGKVVQEQAANELRIDWVTGTTVVSPDGNKIGEINDLIVDGSSGQMIAAIIGVGGFLGMGEKQIAVPFDQLQVNYDAQEIVSTLTRDEAEAAAEYVFREREAAPLLVNDPATMPANPGTAPVQPGAVPMDPAATPVDPAAAPADPAAMPAETETETPPAN